MIDRRLRLVTARLLDPLVARLEPVSPFWLTALGLALGVGAAVAAAAGAALVSAGLWLVNRLADGLDGPVARRRGQSSDRGGYLDMMADTAVYAAIPLALGIRVDDEWPAIAVLVAAFYVNSVSWLYLSAVAERRGRGPALTGETTAVHMPSGVVEGAETIILYTAMLLWPQYLGPLAWAMSALVSVTVVQRLVFVSRWI
jgi:phosphatidylglycerophosphate synthase